MRRPTYESIREAAKRSKRAAIKSSLQKYTYLLSLSSDEVKKLSLKFLCRDGCAICMRYDSSHKCPLELDCKGYCITEWGRMRIAWENLRNADIYDDTDAYYYKFLAYAAKIYIKLLELQK